VSYMPFPLTDFADTAILLLRLMVGLIFFTSGWKDATNSEARSKDIEMSKGFTVFLESWSVPGLWAWSLGF